MAKEYSKDFYNSRKWRRNSKAYANSVNCLCERCFDKGIVKPYKVIHHKTYITPMNINDPLVTMDWNNLEALCQTCHWDEHHSRYEPTVVGTQFDEGGNIVMRDGE